MHRCNHILDVIGRRKSWDVKSLHHTDLTRSLNVLDLIGIGIGSCTGLGIYVTSAHVAKQEAGPAVVLSVVVAGVAALLAGLCHIELATRLPRAGSGYTFCYTTFGELLAFVLGWNLLMENAINGALAAKATWHYLEYMYSYRTDSNVTQTKDVAMGQIFATTPDIFPCCLVIGVTFLTITTVKTYAIVNFVFTSVGGLFVMAFICVGFLHVDPVNWTSAPGFFSHGLEGVVSGAAILMSTFASIDNLASCAEESKRPLKSLPLAFTFIISIAPTAIFLSVMALTLATPWQQLSDHASLARAYEIKGIAFANYVIGSGAVFCLFPVVMGSFLHPVRIIFSMSIDNLFPSIFSQLTFHGVPIAAHFTTGILIALCALLLEFSTLLEMSSFSTILQFVVSPIILLCIRYQPHSIGISQDCTDLNIATAYDKSSFSKKSSDFPENEPKIILLANGEHTFHKEDQSIYTPNTVSPNFYKTELNQSMGQKGVKFKPQTYQSTHRDSCNQFWNSSLESTIKNENYKSSTINLSQKNKSKNGYEYSLDSKNESGIVDNSGKSLHSSGALKRKTDSDGVITGEEEVNQSKYTSIVLVVFPSHDAKADERTWRFMRYCLLLYILTSTCFAITCQVAYDHYAETWWAVTVACLCLVVMGLSGLLISRVPQNSAKLHFKAPHVPLVPLLSVALNMVLLAALPVISWARFAVWLFPGLLVYSFYSRCHQETDDQEVVLFDISQTPTPSSN